MSDALTVLVGADAAGVLTRRADGRLTLEYDHDYRVAPGATPLSVGMALDVASHRDRVVTPWLWNLLPDSDAVLRRWARELATSAGSPFSLLRTPIGEDCAGAVRFVASERLEDARDRAGNVAWLTEDEVARRLRDLRADATAWLGRRFTGQFSLAGAQAKTALLHDGRRWGVPSGATPTTHILKPAIAGLDDHDLNEHLCLDTARRVGLRAARSAIVRFGEETAVAVERYDRHVDADGAVHRIHQEDLCQALGLPPGRKYQNEGGPTPARVGALLRDVMAPRVAEDAVRRFADALIYNWLVAGTDAHAKNYSLLLAGSEVRLAPIYDLASALPYATDEHELRLAMKLGGRYEVVLRRNPWPATARELELDAAQLVDRARELARIVPDALADAVKSSDVDALGRALPARLLADVADRGARCLRLTAS